MVVHPVSHGVSRVPRYSGSRLSAPAFGYGALTLSSRPSHAVLLASSDHDVCPQPRRINPPVWPPPRSLATTSGISVDVFSSPYLDVSVQAVPFLYLFDSVQDTLRWVSPFGNLRIVAHLQLPEAYRSLSRPSSAPDAKAFTMRPLSLDLFKVIHYKVIHKEYFWLVVIYIHVQFSKNMARHPKSMILIWSATSLKRSF